MYRTINLFTPCMYITFLWISLNEYIRTLPRRIKVKICCEKTNFFIGQNPMRIWLYDKFKWHFECIWTPGGQIEKLKFSLLFARLFHFSETEIHFLTTKIFCLYINARRSCFLLVRSCYLLFTVTWISWTMWR